MHRALVVYRVFVFAGMTISLGKQEGRQQICWLAHVNARANLQLILQILYIASYSREVSWGLFIIFITMLLYNFSWKGNVPFNVQSDITFFFFQWHCHLRSSPASTYTWMYVCIYVYMHIYACMHVCTCMYVRVYIHAVVHHFLIFYTATDDSNI